MVQISGIKMLSAEDICHNLHSAKQTAYAIMKAKEAGARYMLILSFKYIKTALNYRNKKTNIIKDS